MEQNIGILDDNQFDIDGYFNYIDNLDCDDDTTIYMYEIMINSLLDNIENGEFKFKLPLNDKEIWICLKTKNNILKVIDFIIKHFYTFELYEVIDSFIKIKEYYENEVFIINQN